MRRRFGLLVGVGACVVATSTLLSAEGGRAASTVSLPCIPTEPMPIVGLGAVSTDRMPVVRPEGHWPTPVIRRVPCYLRDTLAALERREGGRRASRDSSGR